MRVAQIAPPWIPVPPVTYGGTELMVAALIRGLTGPGGGGVAVQRRGFHPGSAPVWAFSHTPSGRRTSFPRTSTCPTPSPVSGSSRLR